MTGRRARLPRPPPKCFTPSRAGIFRLRDSKVIFSASGRRPAVKEEEPGVRLLALAFIAVLGMAEPAAAQQVRNLANINGWRAFVVQSDGGLLCGMGTDANRLGRFFWIKVERLRGELHGFVQVGDRSWNVRQEARGQFIVAIDSRRAELNYIGTSNPEMIEASYQGAFNNFISFVETFAAGYRMQLLFPGENVAPWSADLRGTRAVTEAFLACARRI